MTAYYNEIDPYAADWLENLIREDHIAPGVVDRRSILDVRPSDLRGFTQHHFFAGVGVWSYSMRRAGWPDERHAWSASCPCQPFSAAGKGGGFDDERHLWPALYHLARQCGADVIFGEQVASKDGLAWLDLVHADPEAENYSFGAFDLCAAGFGAPHIRQRLYWVADSQSVGGRSGLCDIRSSEHRGAVAANSGSICLLGDDNNEGSQRHSGDGDGALGWPFSFGSVGTTGAVDLLANTSDGQFPKQGGGVVSTKWVWIRSSERSNRPG